MLSRRTRRAAAKAGVLLGLIIGAAFAGLPVLWMLSTSFKANGEVFQVPPRLITENFSFDAYAKILGNAAQMRFFLNSYIVAFAVTALTLLVAILAGYGFSRHEFPLKRTINAVIVSVQAVPPITLIIPYFGLVVALGLYNTYPGLILARGANGVGIRPLPWASGSFAAGPADPVPSRGRQGRVGDRRRTSSRTLAAAGALEGKVVFGR